MQDSFVAVRGITILEAVNAAKIPSVGSILGYVDQGALMSFAPDYQREGRRLAQAFYDHVIHKQKLTTKLSVKNPKIVVNHEVAKRLGISMQDVSAMGNLDASKIP